MARRRVRIGRVAAVAILAALGATGCAKVLGVHELGDSIDFVQVESFSVNDVSKDSVAVAFDNPQTAGNMNVVVIGWYSGTANPVTVTDSTGKNEYVQAIGPTVLDAGVNSAQELIYYASNIDPGGSGGTTINVTWTSMADSPDVRILEYAGVSTLDQATAAASTSATAAVGALTTKPYELLFVAAMTNSDDGYTQPSPGFTQRTITANGNLAEDNVVGPAGTYQVTADPGANDDGGLVTQWVMQAATFR